MIPSSTVDPFRIYFLKKGCRTLNTPNLTYSSKLLSNTTDPIRSRFAMDHEVDEYYRDFARHLDPPHLKAVVIPKSNIFFKNLIVRH